LQDSSPGPQKIWFKEDNEDIAILNGNCKPTNIPEGATSCKENGTFEDHSSNNLSYIPQVGYYIFQKSITGWWQTPLKNISQLG